MKKRVSARCPTLKSELNSFDQAREVARLKEWVTRVSRRERRAALCWGLMQLIERDRLQYGDCLSTSGLRRSFAIVGPSKDMDYIVKGVYPDPVAGGILMALLKGMVAVETGYSDGRPDLIFVPLAQYFGLIHEKNVAGKPV